MPCRADYDPLWHADNIAASLGTVGKVMIGSLPACRRFLLFRQARKEADEAKARAQMEAALAGSAADGVNWGMAGTGAAGLDAACVRHSTMNCCVCSVQAY